MRRTISLLVFLLLGFQVASGQYYYMNKGYDYLKRGWKDTAFKTFMEGVKQGEVASAYGAIVCYLTETGTPRNISKAEDLMAKYALKDNDVCALAANYYGGFGATLNSDYFPSGYVPWRGKYDNRKPDPALALKYAHAAFEKFDTKRSWSGRTYAFHVIFEYEIAGYLNNKYGFKKDVDKALDLFSQYYAKIDPDDSWRVFAEAFYPSHRWYHCLYKQMLFYATDTQDFLDKFSKLKDRKDLFESFQRSLGSFWKNDVFLYGGDSDEVTYPGPLPGKQHMIKPAGAKYLMDHINAATSTDQLDELLEISNLMGYRYGQIIKNARDELAVREERQNAELVEKWWLEHSEDDYQTMKQSFGEQSLAVKRGIQSFFRTYVRDYVEDCEVIDELASLKTHPLMTLDLETMVDGAIKRLRDRDWASEQYSILYDSGSIPEMMAFINDPRSSAAIVLKENMEELLQEKLAQKTQERDAIVNERVRRFKDAGGVELITEGQLSWGSPAREECRRRFLNYLQSFRELGNEVESIDKNYDYLATSTAVQGLEKELAAPLSLAEIMQKEDSGIVLPEDYKTMMDSFPGYHTSYLQDGYAIARANRATIETPKEELDAIKALPMSKEALKQVKALTKKSYLKNK